MERESNQILNAFIRFPDLNIRSGKFPFSNFIFYEEPISSSDFLFPRNSIIGMQAEACFKAYITNSGFYRLLASNLQIYRFHNPTDGAIFNRSATRERETLGELDFIVQNERTQEVAHIELACKFYLYDERAGALKEEKWIGPNRKDSLFEKLHKVASKQFLLLQSVETIETLKRLEIDFPTQQQLCLKAFLFIPKNIDISRFSKNYSSCIVGHWIRQSEFIDNDPKSLFALPKKREWLLPFDYITQWYSFTEIKAKVNFELDNLKSPLVYKRTSSRTERFFVVWW